MYSISYKIEKKIAQGRPIDIDDVKTEKCGINYFCERARFQLIKRTIALFVERNLKKPLPLLPCSSLNFFFFFCELFLCHDNATTVMSQTR